MTPEEDNNGNRGAIVSVDYGRKRTGLACSTPGVSIAFGLTTLISEDLDDLVRKLMPVIREKSAETVIIGFPVTLADKPGTLKDEILNLRARLMDQGVRVYLVDEALSSRKASELLRKRPRKSQKEDIDRLAATIILQEYLDGTLPPISDIEIRELT